MDFKDEQRNVDSSTPDTLQGTAHHKHINNSYSYTDPKTTSAL